MINRVYIIPFFVSLIGFVLLVSMDSVIKILGDRYPILQLLFYNALFSLIPLAYLAIIIKLIAIVLLRKSKEQIFSQFKVLFNLI